MQKNSTSFFELKNMKYLKTSLLGLVFALNATVHLQASNIVDTKNEENYAKVSPKNVPYNSAKPGQKKFLENIDDRIQQEILSFICPANPQLIQKNIRNYCLAKQLSLQPTLSFEYKPNSRRNPQKILLLPLQSNFYRYIEKAPKEICKKQLAHNIEQLIALDSMDLFSDLLLIDSGSKKFHKGQYIFDDYERMRDLVVSILNPEMTANLRTSEIGSTSPEEYITDLHKYYTRQIWSTRKRHNRGEFANLIEDTNRNKLKSNAKKIVPHFSN